MSTSGESVHVLDQYSMACLKVIGGGSVGNPYTTSFCLSTFEFD